MIKIMHVLVIVGAKIKGLTKGKSQCVCVCTHSVGTPERLWEAALLIS